MKKQTRIEEEVEKTLACFESFEPVEPNPFFSTQLRARIREFEEQKALARQPRWSPGVLRPALLSIFLVLNVVSAVYLFQGQTQSADSRSQYLAAFSEDYALVQDDYDLFTINN